MNNRPVVCGSCGSYWADEADISINSLNGGRSIVVKESELARLYQVERNHDHLLQAYATLEQRRSKEVSALEVERLNLQEEIHTILNEMNQIRIKTQHLECIIDILNMSVQTEQKKNKKLLMRYNTMMKEE